MIYNDSYTFDNSKTLDAAYKQLKIAKQCNNDSLMMRANINLSWAHLVVSDYLNSLDYGQEALAIANRVADDDLVGFTISLVINQRKKVEKN